MTLLDAVWNGYAAAMVDEEAIFACGGEIEKPSRPLHTKMGPLLESAMEIAFPAVATMGLDAAALGMELVQVDSVQDRKPKAFATMVITRGQFGTLTVKHSGDVKQIGFSDYKFYYAVFFADCEAKLAMTSVGKASLIFNLVTGVYIPPEYDIRAFLMALTMVGQALSPWFKDLTDGKNGTPEKYVIPLANTYSDDEELKLSSLRGHDKLVMDMLSSICELEVYLCVLSRSGEACSYKLGNWVDVDDNLVDIRVKKLDFENEVLCTLDDNPLNEKTVSIVIWPRFRRLHNIGFAKALQMVEAHGLDTSAGYGLLGGLVEFAYKNPVRAWDYEADYGDDEYDDYCEYDYVWGSRRVCKVLDLCMEAGDYCKCVKVIMSLGGIESKELALKLAMVVQQSNALYNSVCDALVGLVTLCNQPENCAVLALELTHSGKDVAVKIARRVQELVQVYGVFENLSFEDQSVVVEMAMKLLEKEWAEEMLDRLEDGSSEHLEEIARLRTLAGETAGSRLVEILMSGARLDAGMVLELLKSEDREILQALVRRVSLQSHTEAGFRSPCLFEELMLNPEFNKKVADFNKVTISEYNSHKAIHDMFTLWRRTVLEANKLEFSWKQPMAKFPEHPNVEEFLQGPKDALYYVGAFDDNFSMAREFAGMKCFDGSSHNGFSARAEAGGRGKGVFVEIRKTRAAFDELVKIWEERRNALRC